MGAVVLGSAGYGNSQGGPPEVPPGAWDPRFHERSALFWPIRPAAEAFAGFRDWPSVDDYNNVLDGGPPVRFQEQAPRPRRRRWRGGVDPAALYDARITLEGRVPTRARSWHDFMNMLVWVAFPRAKGELHARQHRLIAARVEAGAARLPERRTREQDALAIVDEGSVLLLCEAGAAPAIEDALARRRPEGVGEVVRRGGAVTLLFGHALYEGLLRSSGLTIHAMTHVIPCAAPLPGAAAAQRALADEQLAAALSRPERFTRPDPFRSLPVDARILCGT